MVGNRDLAEDHRSFTRGIRKSGNTLSPSPAADAGERSADIRFSPRMPTALFGAFTMKDPTLRQRAAFCRHAARSTADPDLARALRELADDYERVAFDGIGPEDSLLARTPTRLQDCSVGDDEREDSALSNHETIYLIDDNDFLRDSLRELLESEGFHVLDFASAGAFLRQPREIGVGCIVTDIQMPGMSGLELIEQVRVHDKAIPIIAITAHPSAAVLEAVEAADAILLVKPFRLNELIAAIVDSWRGRLH